MMLPLLLLSLAWAPERPQPPAPAEFQLGAVSVTGVSRYTAAEVTRLSVLRAGQPVRPSDLDNTVKQMSSTDARGARVGATNHRTNEHEMLRAQSVDAGVVAAATWSGVKRVVFI